MGIDTFNMASEDHPVLASFPELFISFLKHGLGLNWSLAISPGLPWLCVPLPNGPSCMEDHHKLQCGQRPIRSSQSSGERGGSEWFQNEQLLSQKLSGDTIFYFNTVSSFPLHFEEAPSRWAGEVMYTTKEYLVVPLFLLLFTCIIIING